MAFTIRNSGGDSFPAAFPAAWQSFRDHVYAMSAEGSTTQLGFYERSTGTFRTRSLRSLLDEVAGLAATLRERTPPGAAVLVMARAPETTLRGYFASLLANRPPAIYPARLAAESKEQARDRLQGLLDTSGARVTITEAARLDALGGLSTEVLPIDGVHEPARARDLIAAESPSRSDIAHYQFSSGSTRQPEAIAVSNENLLVHLEALAARIGIGRGDTLVSWLPLGHDMGLVGKALLAAHQSVDLRIMSPFDFLSRPAAWLRAIASHTGVVTASPSMAFDVATRRVEDSALQGLDLGTWKRAYCGAEPVHIPTLERFVARFEPYGFRPSSLKPTYGLAEATLMATMPDGDTPARYLEVGTQSFSRGTRIDVRQEHLLGSGLPRNKDAILHACLGRPARGTLISLRDSTDSPIHQDHMVGSVHLDGPSISPGTRTADGSVHRAPGPLETGDLGYFHDGELVIVDRIKSIIIWNGENYSAAASEHVLASTSATPASKIAVLDLDHDGERQVVAVVEIARGEDPVAPASAIASARSSLPHPVHEVTVLPAGSMPRTTSGKLRRHKLRSDLSSGRVKPLFRMSDLPSGNGAVNPAPSAATDDSVLDLDLEDARSVVYGLIRDSLEVKGRSVPHLRDDLHLQDDLALDSVDLLEICLGVEDAFHVAVDEPALERIRTVGDVVALQRHHTDQPSIHAVLDDFQQQIPQIWRSVSHQDNRMVTIDGHGLVDLASLNYLGLDLLPEVAAAVPDLLRKWGVHPSWTRAVASPEPYDRLEASLAQLVGSADTIVFPTISLLHIGVLPILVGHGTLIVDVGAHNSIQEAADIVRARGGTIRRFRYEDLDSLEEALRRSKPGPRVIALNGVYSMTGEIPPLGAISALADQYEAEVYVDDAHGIGVIGSEPTESVPYGIGGGGVIQHLGLDPDRFIYVAGLSKSFSSMAAFVTVRSDVERRRMQQASTLVFSGPIPVASLASALAGLEVNDRRGDVLRWRLLEATRDIIEAVENSGLQRDGTSDFPIVNVPIGSVDKTIAATRLMWDEGVLLTPSVFPAAPLSRGGLRMSLTASHTDHEIALARSAISRLSEAIPRTDLGHPPRRVET